MYLFVKLCFFMKVYQVFETLWRWLFKLDYKSVINKYVCIYITGISFWWGGYPKEHAFAQEDSWRQILQFLHETLDVHTATAKLWMLMDNLPNLNATASLFKVWPLSSLVCLFKDCCYIRLVCVFIVIRKLPCAQTTNVECKWALWYIVWKILVSYKILSHTCSKVDM